MPTSLSADGIWLAGMIPAGGGSSGLSLASGVRNAECADSVTFGSVEVALGSAAGFPEPPPYAGDKRIFMAEQFYDVTNSSRRVLHRAFIADEVQAVDLDQCRTPGASLR